jgi:hypothetical protein
MVDNFLTSVYYCVQLLNSINQILWNIRRGKTTPWTDVHRKTHFFSKALIVFKVCPDFSSSYTTNAISMKLYRIDWKIKSLHIVQGFSAWKIFVQLWPLNEKGVNKFIRTAPLIPFMQFQWNFTGLIGRASTWALYTSFFAWIFLSWVITLE